jgi:hypothetical protein
MINRNRWAIESLWCIALVLVLITEFFVMALRTTRGQQTIPVAMIRMGLIRPRAAVALLSLVHPSELDTVDAIARQVETLDPQRLLVVDITNHTHDRAVANLAYRIYPRTFNERASAQSSGSANGQECLIVWPSRTAIVLSCPENIWHFDGRQGGFR